MRLGVNGRFLAAPAAGVQRFALELTTRLVRRADVTLFLPRGCPPPPALDGSARVVRGAARGPLWEQLELPLAARRSGVDVVLHPANAAPLWGGPHVVVLHDLAPMSEPDAFTLPYRLWSRVAHAHAAERAAGVITVSGWSAREIVRLLGMEAERVTVARQGVAPLDHPAEAGAVAAVRARHGLTGRYFLATTGGDPRKGETFLRELWRAWPDAPELAVVGAHAEHVHATRARPDQEGVRALGYVPDEELRALFTGAVALLYPSRFEGFGRPPLEALACGTRVVATPYGPATEVLGDACDLLPADVDAWRAHLSCLLREDCAFRAARIAAGRAHAAGFRWDDAVSAVLDACRDAAGGAP